MKLSVKGLAMTGAVVWGGSMLMVGLINWLRPDYGLSFLNVVDSIYPGYHAGTGLRSVIIVTSYALLDGAIGGTLMAWLYNRMS